MTPDELGPIDPDDLLPSDGSQDPDGTDDDPETDDE